MSRKTYASSKLFLIPTLFALFCGIKCKHHETININAEKGSSPGHHLP